MATTTSVINNATAFITASAAAYWTVSAGVKGNLKEIVIANTSATTTMTVTVHSVPSAGSASSGNIIIPPFTVAVSTMYRIPFNTYLAASSAVQAVASVANLATITISGLEYS